MTASSVSQADPISFNFNVAHVGTIKASLLELASRMNFSVGQQIDDLEEYEVAYLQLGGDFPFISSSTRADLRTQRRCFLHLS